MKTILVIDDEEVVRISLKMLLQRLGYRVISCSSMQAVYVATKVTPDLIISDYDLENFNNGVDLVQTIRETANSDIPTIIMSGPPTNKAASASHGFAFLDKPLKVHGLARLIRRCAPAEECVAA